MYGPNLIKVFKYLCSPVLSKLAEYLWHNYVYVSNYCFRVFRPFLCLMVRKCFVIRMVSVGWMFYFKVVSGIFGCKYYHPYTNVKNDKGEKRICDHYCVNFSVFCVFSRGLLVILNEFR